MISSSERRRDSSCGPIGLGRRLRYHRHVVAGGLAMALFWGGSPGVRAASLDTTADAVLGQPDLITNLWNYPSGSPTSANLALSNAAHVCIAPDQRLYVSDPDNHRVLSWPSAAAFVNGQSADLVIGQPDFVSSAPNNGGVSSGTFFLPQGLAVDDAGNLWVADAFNSRVLKFNNPPVEDTLADLVIGQPDFVSNAQNLGQGGSGPDVALPDGLQFPGRVLVRGSDVYVADSGNSRVLHYTNPTGNKPLADVVFGQFGNFTKRAKDNDGTGINGCCASADNLFNPIGLALDSASNLYVADWANHRVLRYDSPLTTDTTADAVFGQPDLVSNGIDNGGLTAGFQLPIDLAFDAFGNLFVADSGNNRVLVYLDPLIETSVADLVFGQLGSFGSEAENHGLGPFATDADGLFGPTGLALDRGNNLILLDTNNNRALRFDGVIASPFRADFDNDFDVDASDFLTFSNCFNGALNPPASVCANANSDLDMDGDVDIHDFLTFSNCFNGALNLPTSICP